MNVVNGREPSDILDMLADEATVGLAPDELAVLDRMLPEHPGLDAESFHRAAAAIDVATMGEPEAVPAHVMARLRRAAAEGGERGASREGGGASRLLLWSGWLAAAATIVIAIGINLKSGVVDPRIDRMRLLDGGAAVASWSGWEDTETPGVTGDVVWDEEEQAGYMRFVGLPANDPGMEQYQLWIIDRRGMQQRVSGGVFDSPGGRELIVPIEPGLEIEGAAAFAVTIEPAGGVAVSDMSRKSVIAAL